MRLLALIIAVLGLIVTVAFTIFPIGNLTIFPAITTIICGVILLKLYKSDGKISSLPKVIIAIAFIAIVISSVRTALTDDVIAVDTEFEQKEEQSKEDAVKELEGLE